jgi:hypothetical protein
MSTPTFNAALAAVFAVAPASGPPAVPSKPGFPELEWLALALTSRAGLL